MNNEVPNKMSCNTIKYKINHTLLFAIAKSRV